MISPGTPIIKIPDGSTVSMQDVDSDLAPQGFMYVIVLPNGASFNMIPINGEWESDGLTLKKMLDSTGLTLPSK